MDNYKKMAQMAIDIFLEQDQEKLLARYPLPCEDGCLKITFLGDEYRIDCATGCMWRGDERATPNQTLIVFDMLCNPVGEPHTAGRWCTMSEMSGASSSPGEGGLFDKRIAAFAGHADELRAACRALGAKEVPGGEVSFVIDVFDGLPVWMQFWDADDEFPASMTFHWDSATRLYLHFETLWYILFEVMDRLERLTFS